MTPRPVQADPRTAVPGPPGSLAGRRACRCVARCGEASASLAGLECVTEHSPGSESTYLHVRRRGLWWGIRISCHRPAYDCCRDYEQLLLPDPCPEATLVADMRRVVARVRVGGRVVAGPRDVARAIDRLAQRLSHGRCYRDRHGRRWRWDAAAQAWGALQAGAGRPSTKQRATAGPAQHVGAPASPPTLRGDRPLSPRIRCGVRHEMNGSARWQAELVGVFCDHR